MSHRTSFIVCTVDLDVQHHSITYDLICDAAHLITNVEAKWPRSVHDSRIFRESTVSTRLGNGEKRLWIKNSALSLMSLKIYSLSFQKNF